MNKAVDWIENHPDSPHRLELADVYATNEFTLDDDLEEWWTCTYARGYAMSSARGHVQPMIWIKQDIPGQCEWHHNPSRDPEDVAYPEDFE